MSASISYTSEAQLDLHAAHLECERRRVGQGDRLLDELQSLLNRIGEMPLMYGVWERDIRAVSISNTSYVLYYRATDDAVTVAVQHRSRDPATWSRRRP